MSNYALKEHLIGRLGSDLVGQLVSPNMPLTIDEYLDFLIENSEQYIDAYLNKYYDTPIVTDTSNGFLRELTLVFTEYEIWKRAVGDDVPTKYRTSYEDAQKTLDDIIDGKLAPFESSQKNSSIDIISDTKVMGENQLKWF